MSEGCRIDWDAVACASGYPVGDIPNELVEIFSRLHEIIRDANGMSFLEREEYGLRSTQIIGLVILLWKAGILKEPSK